MSRLNGAQRIPSWGADRPPNHYINNDAFVRELKASRKAGQVTQGLGEMFLTLVQAISMHPHFHGYSYREDLVSDAVIVLCRAAVKFDLRRKNPFAYFTTTAKFALGRALKREFRHWRTRGHVNDNDMTSWLYRENYSDLLVVSASAQ